MNPNRTLVVLIVSIALLALWLASVILARWDIARRGLRAPRSTLWLALVAFLPGAGFVVYLAFRLLDLFLEPPSSAPARTWRTYARRPESSPGAGSTIAAAEMLGGGGAAAERLALFHLVAVEGPESGKSFAVMKLPALIGRGQDAAVPLDADMGVSRRHAEIYAQGQALRLRDLGSAHGAHVNGARVQDQVIRPGDRIGVGQTVLQVRVEGRPG